MDLLETDIKRFTSTDAILKNRVKEQKRIHKEMLGMHKFEPIEKEMKWLGEKCRICGNILTKDNCYPSQNDYVCKLCKKERKRKNYLKNRREERERCGC